ncbi:MAG: hypothetical protein GC190_21955 [Alphaproteobacteria bacterium]|nr:hypothetical protein [Alphaproteobacteria bacterium]
MLDALLQAYSWALAFFFTLYTYAKLQTRIMTATDGWLDLISADFFGAALLRAANQSDDSYRARIIANLFRERGTRKAIVLVLEQLTGRTPTIFEFLRPADTGGYSTGGVGYGAGGGYGSFAMAYQAFVDAFRPMNSGIPNVNGYGEPAGGYSAASQASYVSLSQIIGNVTDADIYAAIEAVRPAAVTVWVKISS